MATGTLQDQCVSLERQIQELQVRLDSSRGKRATLQHAHEECYARVSIAQDALSAMATQAAGHPPQADSSNSHSPSLTTPSLHNPATLLLVHQSDTSSVNNTVVGKKVHRGLCTDPLAPPAPIHSFKHCASIPHELLYRATTDTSPLSNFTHQSSRRLIDEYKEKVAESLGCSQSQVCWFAQMHLQVAPGKHLSYSATLSSPKCVASFVLHYICGSLECGMLNAALDAMGALLPVTPCPSPARHESIRSASQPTATPACQHRSCSFI